ncbi:MAG: hypothetical protein GY928_31245, partial [Colwellia sp.]|nr:hypothetical protein [Colwellia sp.]
MSQTQQTQNNQNETKEPSDSESTEIISDSGGSETSESAAAQNEESAANLESIKQIQRKLGDKGPPITNENGKTLITVIKPSSNRKKNTPQNEWKKYVICDVLDYRDECHKLGVFFNEMTLLVDKAITIKDLNERASSRRIELKIITVGGRAYIEGMFAAVPKMSTEDKPTEITDKEWQSKANTYTQDETTLPPILLNNPK